MTRPGRWLPGVAVATMITLASTILATGWLAGGHAVVAGASRRPVTTPAPVHGTTPIGHPSVRGPFRLSVRIGLGSLEVPVAPLRAAVRADGAAKPIDPPHETAQEWNTAAWIEQSAYPASPATGPSYIYGHACRHHACSFNRLTDVAVGATVTVRSASQTVTYRVCARGLSAKAGNLVVPACSGSDTDLVLVTCQYEHGDVSLDNLVVVARLVNGSGTAQS